MNKVKDFWEKCDSTFAHIKADKWLHNEDNVINGFNKLFEIFDPSGKVIIDYGIGGGYLGINLKERNIKKYIGIDIAKRSLDKSKDNLKDIDAEFYLTPIDFSTLNADMFVTHAVIQHFPDEEYLIDFLKNLNNSRIKEIILDIRYSALTIFSGDYSTQEGVRLSCRTNKNYILKYMENYTCISESDIAKSGNQVLYLKMKNEMNSK